MVIAIRQVSQRESTCDPNIQAGGGDQGAGSQEGAVTGMQAVKSASHRHLHAKRLLWSEINAGHQS